MQNLVFIIFGVVIILIFLFSVAVIHIRSLRDDINIRWYNLIDKLQYRQDLVPNLIETVRLFIPQNEIPQHNDLISQIIEIRSRAGKNTKASAEKIVVEHNLSDHLKKLFDLGLKYPEFAKSTNFLELKKELSDIRADIEKLSDEYNQKVRHHNNVIKRPYNIAPAFLLRYKRKQIFEFE